MDSELNGWFMTLGGESHRAESVALISACLCDDVAVTCDVVGLTVKYHRILLNVAGIDHDLSGHHDTRSRSPCD